VTLASGAWGFQFDGTDFQVFMTLNASLQLPPSNASTLIANTQFVQNAVDLSMATIPFALGSTAGGNYSFASKGSGAVIGYTASGGLITSIGTIYNGASGYAVGDLLTSTAGNGDAVLQVTGVTGSAINAIGILYGGSGYPNGASVNVVVNAAYAIPFTFTLTGTLTSNATFIMPAGTYLLTSNQWIVNNNLAGAYTVEFCLTNGSNACKGSGVFIPAGSNSSKSLMIQTDGVNDIWRVPPGPSSGVAGQPLTSDGLGGFGTPLPGLPLPQTGWSIMNCGSLCVYNDFSGMYQDFFIGSSTTGNYRMAYRALPAATYTIVATIEMSVVEPSQSAALPPASTFVGGFFITDGTKLEDLQLVQFNNATGASCSLKLATDTTASAGTENTLAGPTGYLVGCLATFKIVNDGTHRTFYYWSNTGSGGAYTQFYQENTGTFLTETGFGFGGLAFEGSSVTYTSESTRLMYLTATTP
jgi:hypothetical protein